MAGQDRDIEAAADVFIAHVMSTLDREDRIEALATSMFRAAEPRGIWEAADLRTRSYWRARAALKDAGPPD